MKNSTNAFDYWDGFSSRVLKFLKKGSLKLIKQVKIHVADSFLQSVKSVSRYHLKLAYVILEMAVK